MANPRANRPAPARNRRTEIEALIALRQREGLTWRQLPARGGIPFGALTSWQQKLRDEVRPRPAFVDVATASAAPRPAADFLLETARCVRLHTRPGSAIACGRSHEAMFLGEVGTVWRIEELSERGY